MDRTEVIRTIEDHLRSLESWIGWDSGGGNANNAVAFLYTAGRHFESAREITDSEAIGRLRQRYKLLKRKAVERFNLVPVRIGEGREYLEVPNVVTSGGYSGR
ncbi:MAG TPA: hypothetical protein VJI52_04050 [Candidatus Nanoarchaeia archaeon]|nr:hypothetical protein [Candidatus Nanoarchaeia archaeon]